MKNGQLMGSPLSFPILCAINYVAYRSALKQYVRDLGGDWTKAEMLEMPVRVNGDDILFKCNKHFYHSYWKSSVAAIGFSLSPGKNYVSCAFLTVNSEGWKPLTNGRFEKIGYLNTGLVYSGPDGSMRPPLRSAHATMPWTGKFEEAFNGAQNPKRTMARLLEFYGKDVKAHTLHGVLNLFARVEQGGLGIRRPPGIEPGWTYYQQSLAHHLRHKILATVEETRSLGSNLNRLLDLPADYEFPVERNELPWRNVYSTPKAAARSTPNWNRSHERWSTQWTLAPVTLPCRQYEYRLRDLPADEPTFLSYQLLWEEAFLYAAKNILLPVSSTKWGF